MNRKGEVGFGDIVKLILILLVILVGIYFAGVIKNLLSNSKQFTKSDAKSANDFLFSAEDIKLVDKDSACTLTNDINKVYTCNKLDKTLEFYVTIKNQDSRKPLRSFNSGIYVCPSKTKTFGDGTYTVDEDDKCFEDLVLTSKRCIIEQATSSECNEIVYDLSTAGPGSYNIYPVAECPIDTETGCSGTGLTTTPKNVNKEKFITIILS